MDDWSWGWQGSGGEPTPQPGKPLHNVKPVNSFPPNAFGIRGLDSGIGEWGISLMGATSRDRGNEKEYLVLGDDEANASEGGSMPSLVVRQPWEAFEEVGFRCARDVKVTPSGQD